MSNKKNNCAGVAILILDKANFKVRSVTCDEEGYFTMTKVQIMKNIISKFVNNQKMASEI